MKRNVLIILMCLILCGCDATVKISIKDSVVKENVTLVENDNSKFDLVNDTGWSIRDLMKELEQDDPFQDKGYKTKYSESNDKLETKISETTDLKNINSSALLNQCYVNYSVEESEENILIDTGSEFKCYEYYEHLDKIVVELTTNHKVNEHNATKVENDKYIWEFSKNSNKQIRINLTKESEKNYVVYFILIGGIILLISLIIWFVNGKHKNSNSI